jgi:biopolymer transport protein ExbD
MALRPGSNKAVAEINVTPLVDVVLVLLIIFMVLTPLAERQMFMRVPEPSQSEPVVQASPAQVVLLVKRDGRVLLNRDDLPIESAMVTLRAAFDGRPSRVLFLGAEDGVRYERVVQVADEARKAGVNTIGMMTDSLAYP